MIAEALLMATTVWYVPGWMRTQTLHPELRTCLVKTYPGATIKFKSWDGDSPIWPEAVESADKESLRIASEVARLPKEERENLVIVGHSLGGRITVRVLARLAEQGRRVRQGELLGAAIPSDDPDLAKMGGGSELPVLAVCNPKDITLRYVYAIAGGENAVAYGANGSSVPTANVQERVTPSNITESVAIEAEWAKVRFFRNVANHHELFYFGYLKRILDGEKPSDEVMVPQARPNVEGRVMDAGFWWDTLAETNGWKLQRNKVTGHGRIIDPGKVRKAWGSVEEMEKSFEKVRGQL